MPHLQHIDVETDITVRNSAAQLLVELCIDCENKRCLELLDILGKVSIFLHHICIKSTVLYICTFEDTN